MKRKILILTASYGAGHNVAAFTLQEYYKEQWYSVRMVDLVDFLSSLGKSTQSFYQDFCSRYPNVWDITYNILDRDIIRRVIFWVEYPFAQKNFDNIIEEFQPEIVLSTFPFWGGFIKNHIKKVGKNFKTAIVITDAISIHSIWYLKGSYIDQYFVIDEQTKRNFIERFDHKKENITTSFFPIEKKYFINKETIHNKNIYLLLSGIKYEFSYELLHLLKGTSFQVSILRGRNKEDFKELEEDFKSVKNFHFHKTISLKEKYSEIDIFIGKAGGATFSECIATSTPIIVPSYIPGQEEGNLELLKQTETGIYESDPEKVVFLLKYINWNGFTRNFELLKKENACEIIYETIEKLPN